MNQKEKMKKEFLEELDGYFMNFVYLKDMIQVEEHISGLQQVNELAPNFNLIVQCALIDSYMLSFMKLYDKSKQAKTIPGLIEKSKGYVKDFRKPDGAIEKLEEFEEKLKNDEDIVSAINTLRVRRDKYFVHNDDKYFGTKIENDETYLPKYKIWFLRDFTEEVLSYLWEQLSDEKHREVKYNKDLENLCK